MLDIFFLAGISFVGLLMYSTIGITVFRVLSAPIFEKCTGSQHLNAYGSMRRGSRDCGMWNCTIDERLIGVFWPFVGVFFALWSSARFLAKGPSKWGTMLAEFPERAKTRRETKNAAIEVREKALSERLSALGISEHDLLSTPVSQWVQVGEEIAEKEMIDA